MIQFMAGWIDPLDRNRRSRALVLTLLATVSLVTACNESSVLTEPVVATSKAPPNSRFGDSVGNSRGIPIYSNADAGKPDTVVQSGFGEKWQCVEFARRYTAILYGYTLPGVHYAIDFWSQPLSGLRRVANGAPELPQVGDLIIMSGPTNSDAVAAGHVAVVDAVSSTTITIAQQNTISPKFPLTISVSTLGGTTTYTLSALTGFSTVGWFTRKAAP